MLTVNQENYCLDEFKKFVCEKLQNGSLTEKDVYAKIACVILYEEAEDGVPLQAVKKSCVRFLNERENRYGSESDYMREALFTLLQIEWESVLGEEE